MLAAFEWKDKKKNTGEAGEHPHPDEDMGDRKYAGKVKGGDHRTWYAGISLNGDLKGPFKEPSTSNDYLSWRRINDGWEILRDEYKTMSNSNFRRPVEPPYSGPYKPPRLPTSIPSTPRRHRPYPPPFRIRPGPALN